MRTTVTLDDDLAERLRQLAHARRQPFREVLNGAVRAGLEATRVPPAEEPYRVQTFASALRPGVDPARLNQVLDDLEVDDAAHSLAVGPA
ncbi:MAG: ribbon-helix-helix protein, CopG family [Pseudomonadota bacterium]